MKKSYFQRDAQRDWTPLSGLKRTEREQKTDANPMAEPSLCICVFGAICGDGCWQVDA